jgi:hypothetical protein
LLPSNLQLANHIVPVWDWVARCRIGCERFGSGDRTPPFPPGRLRPAVILRGPILINVEAGATSTNTETRGVRIEKARGSLSLGPAGTVRILLGWARSVKRKFELKSLSRSHIMPPTRLRLDAKTLRRNQPRRTF